MREEKLTNKRSFSDLNSIQKYSCKNPCSQRWMIPWNVSGWNTWLDLVQQTNAPAAILSIHGLHKNVEATGRYTYCKWLANSAEPALLALICISGHHHQFHAIKCLSIRYRQRLYTTKSFNVKEFRLFFRVMPWNVLCQRRPSCCKQGYTGQRWRYSKILLYLHSVGANYANQLIIYYGIMLVIRLREL